jgi:hypothetical protein
MDWQAMSVCNAVPLLSRCNGLSIYRIIVFVTCGVAGCGYQFEDTVYLSRELADAS